MSSNKNNTCKSSNNNYKNLSTDLLTIDFNKIIEPKFNKKREIIINKKKEESEKKNKSIKIQEITTNDTLIEQSKKLVVEINFFPGILYLNLQTIIGYIPYNNIQEITFKVIKKDKVVFKNSLSYINIQKGNNMLQFSIEENDLLETIKIKLYLKFQGCNKIYFSGSLNFQLNYSFMENLLNNIIRYDLIVSMPLFDGLLKYLNTFLNRKPLTGIIFPTLASYIPIEELISTKFKAITKKIDLIEYISIRKSMLKILFKGYVDIKFFINNKETYGTWRRVFVSFIGFQLRIFDEFERNLINNYSLQHSKINQKDSSIFFEINNCIIEMQSNDHFGIINLHRALITFQRFNR